MTGIVVLRRLHALIGIGVSTLNIVRSQAICLRAAHARPAKELAKVSGF